MNIPLNISDPTHNRGRINRVNSFDTAQEWVQQLYSKVFKRRTFQKLWYTKGQPQPSGSNQVESCRPQLNCTSLQEDVITSGKDCPQGCLSATVAERDLMLQKCAEPQHNKPHVILYAYIVVVGTTLQVNVIANLT